ncbi:hypothetical protein ACLOJK_038161 [Asimina triloba]
MGMSILLIDGHDSAGRWLLDARPRLVSHFANEILPGAAGSMDFLAEMDGFSPSAEVASIGSPKLERVTAKMAIRGGDGFYFVSGDNIVLGRWSYTYLAGSDEDGGHGD